MISKIITRQDTTANWNNSSVPLACGQLGYDKDKKVLKIGDGSTLWGSLPVLGGSTDAGVTHGQFCGRDNSIVSINVGSTKAKKIYISCFPSSATSTPHGSILTLCYDAMTNQNYIACQGSSAHYIRSYGNEYFSVKCNEVVQKNGTVEYVYDIGFYTESNPTFAKFVNGMIYDWFCIAHDVPAEYSMTDGNCVTGNFFGNGTSRASFFIGTSSINKIYIVATPTAVASAPSGSIYALNYDDTTGEGYLTYQGRDAFYIGHKDGSTISMNITNECIDISYNSDTGFFMYGVEYKWIITTDSPYNASSGGSSGDSNVTDNANSVSGKFVGNGQTTTTFYCGLDNIKSVYIACTPTTTTQALNPTILSLYRSETGGGFTYQGQTEFYLGHKDDSYVTLSLNNGYLTIGATGSSANFASGIEYTWVAFSDNSYSAPSGTINITENGTDIDIAKYAFANVSVAGGGNGNSGDFTQMVTDTYTVPSSSDILVNNIDIDIGFKPRVFAMFIQGKVQQNNNTNLKVTSTFFSSDEQGNILYAGLNFAYKDDSNSNCYSGYSENVKNIFYPTSNGVSTGTEANNVYLKGGATYKWFALR